MKRWMLTLGLAAMLGGTVAAVAGTTLQPPLKKADTKQLFDQQVTEIKSEMQPGGRYEYVDPAERSEVDQGLASMGSLFDRYGSVAAMDNDARIALYNDQEKVNSILTHNDRNRVICRRTYPTGSHIPQTRCATYGEIMQNRTEALRQMDELNRRGRAVNDPNGPGG